MTQKELMTIKILAEAIAESKNGIPSGHLYAHVMGSLDLETYQSAIDLLVKAGLVKNESHYLTWVGETI